MSTINNSMLPFPRFIVRLVVVSIALLLCLFTAFGTSRAEEKDNPAGKEKGAVLNFDIDAEEGKEKHQLLPLLPSLRNFFYASLQGLPQRDGAVPAAGNLHNRLYLLFCQLKVHLA